jgi:hypothetical protein
MTARTEGSRFYHLDGVNHQLQHRHRLLLRLPPLPLQQPVPAPGAAPQVVQMPLLPSTPLRNPLALLPRQGLRRQVQVDDGANPLAAASVATPDQAKGQVLPERAKGQVLPDLAKGQLVPAADGEVVPVEDHLPLVMVKVPALVAGAQEEVTEEALLAAALVVVGANNSALALPLLIYFELHSPASFLPLRDKIKI